MAVSVLSANLVSQKKLSEVLANNSEWLKCYLCQRETERTRNYKYFCNLCQFTKIYVIRFQADFGGEPIAVLMR